MIHHYTPKSIWCHIGMWLTLQFWIHSHNDAVFWKKLISPGAASSIIWHHRILMSKSPIHVFCTGGIEFTFEFHFSFIRHCGSQVTHLRLNSVKFLSSDSLETVGIVCDNLKGKFTALILSVVDIKGWQMPLFCLFRAVATECIDLKGHWKSFWPF